MKKRLFLGALALLAVLLLALTCLDVGLPEADGLEHTVARTADGTLYLAENRRYVSRIYGGTEEGRVSSVYEEDRRWNDGLSAITQVAAGSKGIYFIRELWEEGGLSPIDWQLCLLDWEGQAAGLGGGVQVCDMEVTGLTVYDGTVLVSGVADDGTVFRYALAESGGAWTLARQTAAVDTQIELPEELSVSLSVRIQCKIWILLAGALGVVFLLLFCLALGWARKARTLAVRATTTTALCFLLIFPVVGAAAFAYWEHTRTEDVLEYAASLTEDRAALVSRSGSAALLQTDFPESREAGVMAEILKDGDELYALEDGTALAAIVSRASAGTAAPEILDDQTLSLVKQAADGEPAAELMFYRGLLLAVCASPVTASGVEVGVLLSRTPAESSEAARAGTALALTVFLAALFLFLTVLQYGLLRRMTGPLRALTGQMRAVSEGDLAVHETLQGRDELGELGRTMQEMCVSLAIRDYEVDAMIGAYRRFVPTGLEGLLGRASVTEVSLGDARTVSGSVGLFTVCNREQARAALEDGAYVDFVSRSFTALWENTSACGGQMLAAGFDLAAVPVLYRRNAADGVRAGLDMMGAKKAGETAEGWNPDFVLLLHYAEFLYGVTGTQEQTFPFLSSAEMEFLAGYADRFRAAGMHMVLTEAFMDRLTIGCNTRYIGFVTSPDGKNTYKLYEALDVYPDMERNLRLRYDQRLQEGIRLFYRNDFYLARNIFSALLKVCPRDGVARWYLFACEHFFNSDPDRVDYQLFGVSD